VRRFRTEELEEKERTTPQGGIVKNEELEVK
jgi:hypothetical protein